MFTASCLPTPSVATAASWVMLYRVGTSPVSIVAGLEDPFTMLAIAFLAPLAIFGALTATQWKRDPLFVVFFVADDGVRIRFTRWGVTRLCASWKLKLVPRFYDDGVVRPDFFFYYHYEEWHRKVQPATHHLEWCRKLRWYSTRRFSLLGTKGYYRLN